MHIFAHHSVLSPRSEHAHLTLFSYSTLATNMTKEEFSVFTRRTQTYDHEGVLECGVILWFQRDPLNLRNTELSQLQGQFCS